VDEIPPRIAKLLLEQKPPPPPPKPPEPEPEPEPDAIDKPEPETVAEEPPPPEPEPEPEIDYEQIAREQAQAALLPFTEDLAALADNDVLEKVADARPLTTSVGQAVRNERSMITSKAGTASSGINTANMSRNTGGSGLAGRNTTAIESPVASVGQSGGGARRTGSPRSDSLEAAHAAPGPAARRRAAARKSNSYSTRTRALYLRFTTVRCAWIRHSRANSCCD
jgi:hypothetical protein